MSTSQNTSMKNIQEEINDIKDQINDIEKQHEEVFTVIYKVGEQSLITKTSVHSALIKDLTDRVVKLEDDHLSIKAENQKGQLNNTYLLTISILGWVTCLITYFSDSQLVKWIISLMH